MDYDYFFYIHEGEDYISIATSENSLAVELSVAEGRMITGILKKITKQIEDRLIK